MSLDLSLHYAYPSCDCCGREAELKTVFDANITHNLTDIAREAGLYEAIWHPEEKGYTQAGQLVMLLQRGLLQLKADPARFEALNPLNGWGSYGGFVAWVETYLEACITHPDATIQTRG